MVTLRGYTRNADMVRKRWIVYYMLHEPINGVRFSYPQIAAELLGSTAHTTIITAVKKLMKDPALLAEAVALARIFRNNAEKFDFERDYTRMDTVTDKDFMAMIGTWPDGAWPHDAEIEDGQVSLDGAKIDRKYAEMLFTESGSAYANVALYKSPVRGWRGSVGGPLIGITNGSMANTDFDTRFEAVHWAVTLIDRR